MIRVVVDPSVLISAIIAPDGASADVVRAARDGRVDLVISDELLSELRGVLARRKFRRYLSEEQADRFIGWLTRVGRSVEQPRETPAATRDPKDDYLVALVEAADAVAIVSGDADLLEAEIGRAVLTPRGLLELLARAGPG